MQPEIKEIKIMEVSSLGDAARKEIRTKLQNLPEGFRFRGYAKVAYIQNSPLSVYSVDPIEGDIIDELNRLKSIMK